MVTMRRLSVKAIIQAYEKKTHTHTHKSTSAGMPRFLTQPSGGDFPFHQLFSSSSNQNQLKDGDLICCHSSPLPDLDDRRVSELPQS